MSIMRDERLAFFPPPTRRFTFSAIRSLRISSHRHPGFSGFQCLHVLSRVHDDVLSAGPCILENVYRIYLVCRRMSGYEAAAAQWCLVGDATQGFVCVCMFVFVRVGPSRDGREGTNTHTHSVYIIASLAHILHTYTTMTGLAHLHERREKACEARIRHGKFKCFDILARAAAAAAASQPYGHCATAAAAVIAPRSLGCRRRHLRVVASASAAPRKSAVL